MMEKTALILEGGGMRGMYTAGVLDLFLDQGVTDFDRIYGVSAGACIAASFLARQRGHAFRSVADFVSDKRYVGAYNMLTRGELFGSEFVFDLIPNQLLPLDYEAFSANPCKLTAVATNCFTGKAEYFPVEHLPEDMRKVRASASLPLLAHPVEIDGERYLDGGMADSLPIVRAVEDGYKKIVVVLTRHGGYRKSPSQALPLMRVHYRQYPHLVAAFEERARRYNRALAIIRREEAAGRAFVLRPKEPVTVGRAEKDPRRLTALYLRGMTENAPGIPALRAFLGI